MSLYAHLQAHFPEQSAQPFLVEPSGRTITYAALHQTTGRMTAMLGAQGIRPGDRVAVQVEKSPEALMLYLACLRGGFVFLPLNPAYRADEVGHLLEDAEPAAFVGEPRHLAANQALAARHGVSRAWTLGEQGEGSLLELASQVVPAFEEPAIAPDDVAVMIYTSGTTGRPKGAMLTHRNLAANADALVAAWRFAGTDVLLHALPIFHVHGLLVATHCALASGSQLLWLARFDPAEVIAQLPQATVYMGVPTHYTRLLNSPALTREVCGSLRLFVSGSAPLLAETHREFLARTGHTLLERYGMTETGMLAGNPYDGERRPGTVGMAFEGVGLRVVEGDAVLGANAVGEIQVQGANVMSGYWKRERTLADFTADGWFRTGDLGRVDEEGYLHIVGRAKDMIISGGFNVYPKEIEALLDELPGVVESAVVGVPHPDFGEVGVAVLLTCEPIDEAAILAHLKEKLANFKVPKRVLATSELPRNAMGKIQKAALRQEHAALFASPGR